MTEFDFNAITGYTKPAAGKYLEAMAKSVPADLAIVEIGVFHGRSTLYLAKGASEGNGATVFAIDPWNLPGERYPAAWAAEKRHRSTFTLDETYESAKRNIEESPWADRVQMIRGFGVTEGERWNGPKVGLLHIDGNHEDDHPYNDFKAWQEHLVPSAVVLWDDWVAACPAVDRAIQRLVQERLLTPPRLAPGCRRLAVTRYVPKGVTH